jgi:starch synthase
LTQLDRRGKIERVRAEIALLTREYPPEVYGGAGVHVEYLARELSHRVDLTVHCFGADRPVEAGQPAVRSHQPWDALAGESPYADALRTMSVDLAMAAAVEGVQLVHSHTWYAQLGGHLAKLVHGIPHVVTVHSLEPLRPWKAEQLGGGYQLSSFCEQTAIEGADAVIAVSAEMGRDALACYPAVDPARLKVIYNGIDTEEYRPDRGTDVLERYGVDPTRLSVVFVGRITRQKGVAHLLEAALAFEPEAQLVLCAGAPDTPQIAREIADRVERVRRQRGNVVWIDRMITKPEVIQLLSQATLFVCPSIYEPLGIVNLEAMACETAVVGTDTGGIPEVVEDGVTGLLVPFEPGVDSSREPVDPQQFARDLAERVNALLADPKRAEAMGKAGRQRAIERFSWSAIADQTVDLYASLVGGDVPSGRAEVAP